MQNKNNIFTNMRESGIHTTIKAIERSKDMVKLKCNSHKYLI